MLIIDTHADTPQRFADEDWLWTDGLGAGHLNNASAEAGGLGAEFFAIWPEPRQWAGRYAHRTLALIDAVRVQVERHPKRLMLCLRADEIEQAHREGRFGVLMGIEGGHAIENSLALLRGYYSLGVRYMTLTWANSNEWADSSGDLADSRVTHHGGLTGFGSEVIGEMNRLGMLVDVSHVSDATFWDVLSATRAPVLASHSSARAITSVPRNLADEMLQAIAAQGGAAMVNFYPGFLDERWKGAWAAMTPERRARLKAVQAEHDRRNEPVPYRVTSQIDREFAARIARPPLSSLLDHLEHMVRVAGVDHVGIGTDFDGVPALPEGIDSAADLPKVVAGMRDRGFATEDLRKILGGNLLRVMRAVESEAQKRPATFHAG